jgi:hypothetical protein
MVSILCRMIPEFQYAKLKIRDSQLYHVVIQQNY